MVVIPAPDAPPGELDAAALAGELGRDGGPLVVDVRRRPEFDAWHLDGTAPIVNIPLDDLRSDPGAVARLAGGRPVRVICARGNTSREAVEILAASGITAVSVRGGMIAWSRVLVSDPVPVPGRAEITQFRREARGCLSYLVAAGGEAMVVDPAPDPEPYLGLAHDRGLAIRRVVDTHVHADHLSGARRLAAAAGAALHVSPAGLERGVVDPGRFAPIADGDRLPLGPADVRVLALPGHTTDNIGLIVEGAALIAGDSIFTDSVARPDLEAGDHGAAAAARTLHATIHGRILALGDDVVILPCHYPGGPAAGPVLTTVGRARREIRLLGLDAGGFAREVLAAMPPRPENYLGIIDVNMRGDPDGAFDGLEVGANNCAATIAGAAPS